MEPIEPWIYGLLELMKHAEEHQHANEEFDRRIALIGYDNAIEVSISTYLQLHPTQRRKIPYPKEHIDKCADYPKVWLFPRDAQRVCSVKSNWRESILRGFHLCLEAAEPFLCHGR